MYHFGSNSKKRRDTLHPDLQKLCDRVITMKDFSIVSGYRGKEEQDSIPAEYSGIAWPHSKHNHEDDEGYPQSLAVDVAPFPLRWQDTDDFCVLAGMFMAVAHEMGIKIRWGGYWPKRDYGHIELVDVPKEV